MNKPQGIRDGRGSCCGSLTRLLGAMSKLATGSVGSRHSSTGSSNRHHEARNPAHRPSGRLPSSLRTATAARIITVTRAGCGFLNGSAVWLSDGFDTGCSFVAARLNQFQGEDVHVLAQPVSGRGRSRAGSTSFRERTFTCWLNQLEGRKLVEPTCSLPEEHPLGFTPQLLGFRHVCTLGGLAFQDCQEFRGAS